MCVSANDLGTREKTFVTFQANKNNEYACIKFWILFHNVAWLPVPEYPDVLDVLSLVHVDKSGSQGDDNRQKEVKESIPEGIMLELGCEGKREIHQFNKERMNMMGMGQHTCKERQEACKAISEQPGSLLLSSPRSLLLPVS